MEPPDFGPGKVPGAYALLIKLDSPLTAAVGKLGLIHFKPGGYCYVGSAMNGLKGRVARHLRPNKRPWWHVDYLLLRSPVTAVVWSPSAQRLECRVAEALRGSGLPSTRGFGASDCSCPSHLFHLPAYDSLGDRVMAAFRSVAGASRTHHASRLRP